MTALCQQVTIVGVGLIGGSLGMVLKEKGLANSVVGLGRSRENLKLGVELGAIDRYERDPRLALQGTDLVVLATPIESYASHVTQWGALLEPGAIISDVGSVKGPLVEQVETLLPPEVHFVGAHPIAGKEQSGVQAGSSQLFQGSLCIVTPTDRTNAQALDRVCKLWEVVGSHTILLDPHLHDWILGAVSHFPHVVAFTLMNALGEIQQQSKEKVELLRYSGGGLRDTTRIAASSPEMWRDISLWNRENLLSMIETYERHLIQFKNLLKAKDGEGLEKVMSQARTLRGTLR